MLISPPQKTDFGFYNAYVFREQEKDLITALSDNWNDLKALAAGLTEEQLSYRYDTGKWSIKEIFVHFIDAERNFNYRVMRISRGDQAPLPMYDIHQFIMNAHAAERPFANIMQELELIRKATITMYEGMHPSMLEKTGPARDVTVTVRAIAFATVGHVMHHLDIIHERYLKN